ncbi:unnamed protein product [Mytilus edulis]|uniref:Uncharacterized protein n=1 Tax=Mytilus edulis TaxID=6550 RepID=A0A8S3R3R4_MYTED|nr:unnamed protein product [Mytilus edulis]
MNVACTNFTNSLLDIASECIPTREVVVRCDDKIWYNSNLRREMRKRDRFRKVFLRLKTSFAELKFKQQRNKVNNMKKQAKKHFYASLNENLDEIKQANPKQYWKIINMHIKSDRPVRDVPPLKDPNQNYNLAYESSEKSEILNKYFCSIANLENPDKDLPAFNDRCADFLSSIVVSEQDGVCNDMKKETKLQVSVLKEITMESLTFNIYNICVSLITDSRKPLVEY